MPYTSSLFPFLSSYPSSLSLSSFIEHTYFSHFGFSKYLYMLMLSFS